MDQRVGDRLTLRSGLAHLVMGSVAERVLRQSPVPVLTVRVPDAP